MVLLTCFFLQGVKAETVSPEVVGLSPKTGSINVNFNNQFAIEFDRRINLGSGFFIFKNLDDDSVLATVDVKSILVSTSRGSTVIVNLNTDDLSEVEKVYIEISPGAITDELGNPFEGISDSSWNFSGSPEVQELQTGVLIEANRNGSFPDSGFIRYEYALTRSDNNQELTCKIRYPGIQKKAERYLFPIGSKEIIARLRLKRRKIRRLKKISDEHVVTINMSCTDGSTDTATVNLSL